jgi:hypothetical protein
MKRKLLSLLVATACSTTLAIGCLTLSSCGGGGGGSVTTPTGTLKVALTDKLSDDFAEVRIKVKAVKVVPIGYNQNADDNDPALIPIPLDSTLPASPSFNVLSLAFIQQLLGTAVLPAGTYSQVRLILEPNPIGQGQDPVNYVTLKTAPTTKIPLKTPSAQQSGLKVVGSFVVQPGVINAIALDFDPNTAIVDRGNTQQSEKYILKPTGIRIMQMANVLPTYGSISGIITALTPWSSATVSVVPQGQTSPIAAGALFNNYTSAGWAPFTSNVPAGTYRVHVQSTGFRPYSSPLTPVSVRVDSPLGTITLQP